MSITGWSLHLPGVHLATALAGQLGELHGAWAYDDPPPPEKASVLLGRKGLLAKEPSTRLALCAVHRALGMEPGERPDWPLRPGTAVIACSNLGNVDTVARVTRTVADEGGKGVSVLDAPNASSNIVASSVALWFRFGGPNLMICSGATSGLDGLRLASLLLRARRADRVVLVGAEPADDVAAALYGASGDAPSLRAGAACVVLEASSAPTPAHLPAAPERRLLVELSPSADGAVTADPEVTIGAGALDVARLWGDCYGAQRVVELALAAHLAADEGRGPVAITAPGTSTAPAAVVARGQGRP